MGTKIKEITDHKNAVKKLAQDVGNHSIHFFDVPAFEKNYYFTNYPRDYLSKCSGVTVAVSSSDDTNWMTIAPYRVDNSGSTHEKVYDLDPMIVTLDSDNKNVSPSAYVGYHQSFESRSIDIKGYSHLSKEDTVTELRKQFCSGSDSYTNAPKEIDSAMQHMATILRNSIK